MTLNIQQTLHDWYQENGRKTLPWRLTTDAYHIYVSEVMLQQTQVKTVLERFYFPFLEAFPSLEALANANLEEVLKMWQGLGYYSRARNLHRAAQIVAPHLPQKIEELIALPGIGKNTAHAIAALAFHQSVPVMEANVKRILSRFFALTNPTPNELWDCAHKLLNCEDPFTHNQAMMDIGALVCTPKNPDCRQCPLRSGCAGKETPERYPEKKVKKAIPIRQYHIFLHYNSQHQLYLEARTTRFLNGMYGFDQQDPTQVLPDNAKAIGQVTHQYSHFTLKADIFVLASTKKQHYTRQEINALPLSGADEKALLLWDNWVK